MFQIAVTARPASNVQYRHRAGRRFTVDTTILRVVEAPSKPDEITRAQLAEIEADPMLFVRPAVDGDPSVLAVIGRLSAAEREVEALRGELASVRGAAEVQSRAAFETSRTA